MATRTQIVMEDDLDGSVAEETLNFTIDGVTYEIDLNTHNASKFRDSVAPWISHARRTGGRRAAGRRGRPGNATDIRAWAIAHGMSVSSRGRVPQEVKDAYKAAH